MALAGFAIARQPNSTAVGTSRSCWGLSPPEGLVSVP